MESANFRNGYESSWIQQILLIHNRTELKRDPKFSQTVSAAFAASFAVVSAWQGDRLVGFGRMISDGHMYSSIFDVVIDPDYQNLGYGKKIMQMLIAKAPHTCIHLTSTFGNDLFYRKLGFRKHKTAMALYPKALAKSPYLSDGPLAQKHEE